MLILVANEKGGSGKTTIAVNLAAMAANMNYSTALVDADRQQSSVNWGLARDVSMAKINVLPLRGKIGKQLLSLKEENEVVIVDVGGYDSDEMRQSLVVADQVIIPINPSQLDLWGLGRMVELKQEAEKLIGDRIYAYPLITRASSNPHVKEVADIRLMLEDYHEQIPALQTVIVDRVSYPRAVRDGLGVVEYHPRDSKAFAEMSNLFKEIFNVEYKQA